MAKKHDEVMAMTDVELRFKASELMGITDGAIPDYPNDIAAAFALVDKLIEIDLDVEFSIMHDTLREVGPWHMDGWMPTLDISFRASAETIGRAITRAFILAMDGS